MGTVGNQPGSWGSWRAALSGDNQIGTPLVTMPSPGGIITSVSAYLAGNGASLSGIILAVWDASDNIIARSSPIGTGVGSGTSGGQSWITAGVPPVVVQAGVSLRVGWWRPNTQWCEWSEASGGSYLDQTAAGGIGGWGGAASVAKSIGAYATYTDLPNLYVNGSRVAVFVNGALATAYVNGTQV